MKPQNIATDWLLAHICPVLHPWLLRTISNPFFSHLAPIPEDDPWMPRGCPVDNPWIGLSLFSNCGLLFLAGISDVKRKYPGCRIAGFNMPQIYLPPDNPANIASVKRVFTAVNAQFTVCVFRVAKLDSGRIKNLYETDYRNKKTYNFTLIYSVANE